MVLPLDNIDGISPDEVGEWMNQHMFLQNLAKVQLRIPDLNPVIHVSRPVFSDCQKFLEHVEDILGLSS